MRFHILGIPHTATNSEHNACAYTQKVLKLCKMLEGLGHRVVHYGNEASRVDCEHVTVSTEDDLEQSYGREHWREETYRFGLEDHAYRTFFSNAIRELGARKRAGDFLLCMWGAGHRPIADAHADLIAVEPGIGYASGHFARFKVFESYALLHAYLGLTNVADALMNGHWYDVVIPNFFDPNDFTFKEKKSDYLLFLGRVGPGKGVQAAVEAAQETRTRLVVAGQRNGYDLPSWVEFVGFADKEKRRELLSDAKALMCPSLFVEPFGGVSIEAMFSGTPVISTDWGAFSENNLHGHTGYRCRTMEQFCWAVRNIDRISPHDCRAFAQANFSMKRVAFMYEEFFNMVADVALAGRHGFYEHTSWGGAFRSALERDDLGWLRREYPPQVAQNR